MLNEPPDKSIVPAQNDSIPVIEGEILRSERLRRREQARLKLWLVALAQILAGIAVAIFFYLIPLETLPSPFQSWKNPIVVFLVVVFIGKTLYDTLFYNHYQP
jgi:sterol desaturase/sphingolipid hydroxylase (fatty acid hydroxylase superfamily)